MAKCAIRLLKDSSLCNEIGRNGKAWAREEFSLEKNLKKLLALYHEYGR
jgi:glycosyltransferase involved in cell wall biosynthesis